MASSQRSDMIEEIKTTIKTTIETTITKTTTTKVTRVGRGLPASYVGDGRVVKKKHTPAFKIPKRVKKIDRFDCHNCQGEELVDDCYICSGRFQLQTNNTPSPKYGSLSWEELMFGSVRRDEELERSELGNKRRSSNESDVSRSSRQ